MKYEQPVLLQVGSALETVRQTVIESHFDSALDPDPGLPDLFAAGLDA